MRAVGLTPWRIFLILWAALCTTVSFAAFGHRWAIVACAVIGYLAFGVGVFAFVAACALRAWVAYRERRGGESR